MIDWFIQQFETNMVFSGLVGASGIGALVWLARSIPSRAFFLAKRHFTVEIVIHNDDDAFVWINEWLARHPYTKRARRLKLSTFHDNGETEVPDGGSEGNWTLAPGEGLHWFWHGGNFVLVQRNSSQPEGGATRRRMESFTITIVTRDVQAARRLINDARVLREGDERLEVYRYAGYWQRVARKLPRSLDTVYLPVEQKSRIVEDAERFFASRDWYAARGVPWRRGYLFEGEPGTGKTTMAMALASHLSRPLYVLNLGSLEDDDALIEALTNAPSFAILLIEDIDGTDASHVRDRKAAARGEKDKKERRLTTSALLNAIDGSYAADGRLLLMTTNRPEVLDAAMLRPGRIDLSEHFGPAEPPEVQAMYRRFFANNGEIVAPPEPRPAAEFQAMLLLHRDDPVAARQAIEQSKGPTP